VDGEYGAGRLDAYAALKAAGASLTTGPAAPGRQFFEGTLSGSGAYVDYKLAVADTTFPIAATLIHPGIRGAAAYSPDFDLYLYNPSGGLVASAETVQRQETIGFKPTATGTYTLRVRSYYGSGSYYVDASGGFGTVAAPPPAPTTVTAAPSSVALYSGSVRSGGAAQLAADDNAFFAVNSTTSGTTRVADWYGFVPATNSLQSLKVTYRGRSSYTCTQVVYVYNWTTSTWVQLDSRSVGTSEVLVERTPAGTLADYVSGTSGDGDVAVRLRCARGDAYSFFTSGDLLRITYQR
jgi:hypothetical protein